VCAIRTACVKAALALLGVCLLAGCGQSAGASAPAAVSANGLSVQLPDGWQSAEQRLTRLEDPREMLAVGTFPLRYREVLCPQVPSSALEDLGAGDALVTLQERGTDPHSTWPDFPPRPAHFGPTPDDTNSDASACVPGAHFISHWFRFTDAGRHFHVLVAFGPQATQATQEQAWSLLDGLKVDPEPKPDWESAG
jgi:hypothetical protein